MNEERRKLLLGLWDAADRNVRYYFNFRLGVVGLFILSLGAITAYAWASGFDKPLGCVPERTRVFRGILLFFTLVFWIAIYFTEENLRDRYDVARRLARLIEIKSKTIFFHRRLRELRRRITLRRIAITLNALFLISWCLILYTEFKQYRSLSTINTEKECKPYENQR